MFQASGAKFLGPDHVILDDETLQMASTLRVPLIPWTVNDPAVMSRLLRSHAVLGIITDHLATALDLRARGAAQ